MGRREGRRKNEWRGGWEGSRIGRVCQQGDGQERVKDDNPVFLLRAGYIMGKYVSPFFG